MATGKKRKSKLVSNTAAACHNTRSEHNREHNLDIAFYDIVGLVGMGLVVIAYLLLQLEILSSRGLAYNLMNLCGASFLLISLLFSFNLASFVIELFWIAASLVGLAKYLNRKASTRASGNH
jgi:predicted membrane protein